MSAKKTPMRMCTGCREMKPKQQLIRIVKTPDGEIKLDTTGRLNGRGAYICKSADCLKKAQKAGALSRAFETDVADEVYAAIERELLSEEQ